VETIVALTLFGGHDHGTVLEVAMEAICKWSREQYAAAMQTMTRHCHPAGYPALMQAASRGMTQKSSSKPLEGEIMRET